MNQVQLIGNLGKDIELRTTTNGESVASVRIATSSKWTDKSGQLREETEWHDVEIWGKQAQAADKHLAKGSRVFVQGRLKTEKWQDKDTGKDRFRVKIVASYMEFLSPRPNSSNGEQKTAP